MNTIKKKLITPQFAVKAFINLIVLASEVRVFATMMTLTEGNVLTSSFSVLASGVPFVLWYDIIESHAVANKWQKLIDAFMTVWSIFVGLTFVFADFAIKVHLNGVAVTTELLVMVLAGSTALNIFAGIAWTWLDEETSMKKQIETAQARRDMRSRLDAMKNTPTKRATPKRAPTKTEQKLPSVGNFPKWPPSDGHRGGTRTRR